MIKNIEFKYGKNVHADEETEGNYKNNINMWLSEFADELNKENAIIEYWINNKGSTNRITFKNISPQLHRKVIEELNRFGI